MAVFPQTFPFYFNPILQPDMLVVLRTYLLTLSDITDLVEQRIFTHSIPEQYSGTDCIVLSDIPSPGADRNAPITNLSVSIKCFSQTKQTARDIERTVIFPNLHQYNSYVVNDGSESFGNNFYLEIYQTQSGILLQDPDYKKEYWFQDTEYEIILRY
ncbi:MAG: hypothetical protein ACTSXD_08730 [Candidatus Heimdallarchaeaceae archaeon]